MQSIGRYKNQSWLKDRRKNLRKFQTKPEWVLWQKIRNKKLEVKFRRQFNIDHYIVDFYCHELKLIIELDGWSHAGEENRDYDKRRDSYLKSKGYYILRYQNIQIKNELDAVVQDILNHIDKLKFAR